MGDESPKPASTPTGPVFLSYAPQDAEAARRICDALRAAGIEVWFDQSELRGGDAWDQSIRKQIRPARSSFPSSPNTGASGSAHHYEPCVARHQRLMPCESIVELS